MEQQRLLSLNKEQAELIRQLRVVEGYSWRKICVELTTKYPELSESGKPTENQLLGVQLCNSAQLILNQQNTIEWYPYGF